MINPKSYLRYHLIVIVLFMIFNSENCVAQDVVSLKEVEEELRIEREEMMKDRKESEEDRELREYLEA